MSADGRKMTERAAKIMLGVEEEDEEEDEEEIHFGIAEFADACKRARDGRGRSASALAGWRDADVEGADARQVREPVSKVDGPSGLRGYEGAGEPIVEEDEEGGA